MQELRYLVIYAFGSGVLADATLSYLTTGQHGSAALTAIALSAGIYLALDSMIQVAKQLNANQKELDE